jgi:hypothetical protein
VAGHSFDLKVPPMRAAFSVAALLPEILDDFEQLIRRMASR